MSIQENHSDRLPSRISARKRSGLYLESTEAEQLGVLPHECTRVKEAMSRSVCVYSPLTEVVQAVGLMKARDTGVIIVCNGRELMGTLSERNIALANAHPSEPLYKFMNADPSHCFENDLLVDALATMRARGLTALPVLDSSGLLSGVVVKTAGTR
jgi:CBS domain-containing protein